MWFHASPQPGSGSLLTEDFSASQAELTFVFRGMTLELSADVSHAPRILLHPRAIAARTRLRPVVRIVPAARAVLTAHRRIRHLAPPHYHRRCCRSPSDLCDLQDATSHLSRYRWDTFAYWPCLPAEVILVRHQCTWQSEQQERHPSAARQDSGETSVTGAASSRIPLPAHVRRNGPIQEGESCRWCDVPEPSSIDRSTLVLRDRQILVHL